MLPSVIRLGPEMLAPMAGDCRWDNCAGVPAPQSTVGAGMERQLDGWDPVIGVGDLPSRKGRLMYPLGGIGSHEAIILGV